jgi:hypothetical protein
MVQVKFGSNEIQDGQLITTNEAKQNIFITWNANSNQYYTLIIYDATISYCHALITSIPGMDVAKGNMILPYKPPSPPDGSEPHTYYINIYEQSFYVDPKLKITRKNFNLDNFVRQYGLQLFDKIQIKVSSTGNQGTFRSTQSIRSPILSPIKSSVRSPILSPILSPIKTFNANTKLTAIPFGKPSNLSPIGSFKPLSPILSPTGSFKPFKPVSPILSPIQSSNRLPTLPTGSFKPMSPIRSSTKLATVETVATVPKFKSSNKRESTKGIKYFKDNTELSDEEQKYCRCVLHVASEQPGACNMEKAWFEKKDNRVCYNPYAVCASRVGTTTRNCSQSYEFGNLNDDELIAYANLHKIQATEPYNRSMLLDKIASWKQTEKK